VSRTAFLFDLDGTLIDSIDLIIRSYRHTLKVHRGFEPPDELWMRGVGQPLRVQFRAFTDDEKEIEEMIATYREFNFAHHDDLVRAYPGIVPEVKRLRAAGHRMGVVTSKMRAGAMRGLRLAGIEDDFEVVVGADDVPNPKPHPEPVLEALKRLNVEPAHAAFVGDSRFDIESGHAAGVRAAAALWGPFGRADLDAFKPDHWLEKPADLAEVEPRLRQL
jgi:pyrophosphatase PpaX